MYALLKDDAGKQVDIVNGDLVLSPDGFLTLSRTPSQMCAYIDDTSQSVTPIVPLTEYRGHQYKLRKRDCITLYARWHDDTHGTSLLKEYLDASNTKFLRYYMGSLGDWFIDNGFLKVKEPQQGDCLFYNYGDQVRNHLGVYLESGKILHHVPHKYSGVDAVEAERVLGIYRYAHKTT